MLRMARDKEAGGDVGGNERERGRARVMRGHGGCCALRRKDGDESWWKNCDPLWWRRTWYWMLLWWVVTEELWYILVMTDVMTEWSCHVWLWKKCDIFWWWHTWHWMVLRCVTMKKKKFDVLRWWNMQQLTVLWCAVMRTWWWKNLIYCGDVIRSNMRYCDMWWCRHGCYGDEELWGCAWWRMCGYVRRCQHGRYDDEINVMVHTVTEAWWCI